MQQLNILSLTTIMSSLRRSPRLAAKYAAKCSSETKQSNELSDYVRRFQRIDGVDGPGKYVHYDRPEFSHLNDYQKHDGLIFEGNFVDGYLTGYGLRIYKGRRTDRGEFKNSILHGVGYTLYQQDDEVTAPYYYGEYKDGVAHGFGRYDYGDGVYYEGQFVDDRIEGEGECHYNTTTYYKGTFKNGKKHGYGTKYKYNIPIMSGKWENGVFCENNK